MHLEVPVKDFASSTAAVLNTQARAGRSKTEAKLIGGAKNPREEQQQVESEADEGLFTPRRVHAC